MAGNLKNRLARLRDRAGVEQEARALGLRKASELSAMGKAPQPLAIPARRSRPSFLEGWEAAGELLWTRVLRYQDPLPDLIDPSPFQALVARRGRPGGSSPPPVGSTIGAEGLRFFDLETTGLSGGSGTIAFLAAVGRREEGAFTIRQYFLEDYPGEVGFVGALLRDLVPGTLVVTYNGRAFDLPLLRTRCVMNGLSPPILSDLDALYAARRLWRRVHGGASLGLLEREVLGVERGEDIPGSMIPEVWFSFLREGDHPAMRAVMSHNAEDVVGLARLLARASRVFGEPSRYSSSASVDRSGLGRTLLAIGRGREGEGLLEAALGEGDEDAGLTLSRLYRREGRFAERRRILGMLPRSRRSAIEVAKFLEHVDRDFAGALEWARIALEMEEGKEEALRSRIARLERKLVTRGKGGVG